MWPLLLDLTLDECRRTLRSLELEAYANMMSVFRAQGPLEENRKKILEELRGVLHISNDRHSAEARRVSNDELLATIAHRLYGPYTNLGWICEGRRRVPLLPRGVPQTMYTELADRAAAVFRAENDELRKRLNHDTLEPAETKPELEQKAETLAQEAAQDLYPVAMEDPTIKLWDTELISRKRKVTETSLEDTPATVKNIRNISVNTNQKHVNLSQLYSKFSHQATSKPNQKHSYNQVSKVSTSKASQATARVHKQRSHKIAKSSAQHMSAKQRRASPSRPPDFAAPSSFQATYAQSVLGKHDPPPAAPLPATQSTPTSHAPHTPHAVSGKPCQLIIKKRGEISADPTLKPSEAKPTQKPIESIKLLSSRPLVVGGAGSSNPSATPSKVMGGKLVAAVGAGGAGAGGPVAAGGPAAAGRARAADKLVVLAACGAPEPRHKLVVTSSGSSALAPRAPAPAPDALTPKGIPATDLKVSAKTFVLNPKSGQKMVVVPAKPRTKSGGEGQVPVLHFKGMSTPMKLVPMGASAGRVPPPRPAPAPGPASPAEGIRTANMADIVPVKGLPARPAAVAPVQAQRPAAPKPGVIVVQKGATLGKALTFTKNGSDVSKIIMGKNVNQLLQASKAEAEGNVIVLELNNEQSARATTVSEILGGRTSEVGPAPAPGPAAAAPAAAGTDWEMELDTVAPKGKDDDKLNSLHLDLGMSSDSDDYLPPPHSPAPAPPRAAPAPPPPPLPHTGSSGTISIAARTLLSQLQDEGSSSNDSSFALKPKHNRSEAESDALAQAKEKLTEKVAADKARLRRIDVFSTAIAPTDINLDSFSYLEDDDDFDGKRPDVLHDQLSRLLDDTPVTQLNKQ